MRVAKEAGKYNNFTGEIVYEYINCRVKDASFELLKEEISFKKRLNIIMIFYSGDITEGSLINTDIKNCTFRGDKIEFSIFRNGLFNGNVIMCSYWLGGRFNGHGYSPLYDKFGRLRYKTPKEWDIESTTSGTANKLGTYNNFSGTIKWKEIDVIVKDAEFELTSGISYKSLNFLGGTIVDGTITDARIQSCIFENGKIEKSNWKGGVFRSGTWFNGYWYDGIWESGHWLGGTWHGGYDKSGIYHIVNPPNKWNR